MGTPRRLAVPREGRVAPLLERLPPGAEQVLADVEAAGDLGHGPPLVGDHPHGGELELGRVRRALPRHRRTPWAESTPLTSCPRTLGNLNEIGVRSHPAPTLLPPY